MLHYTTQNSPEVFDNVLLTTAYADRRVVIDSAGMSKLAVFVDYARGAAEAASKMFVSLEVSPNGADWYSLVIDETSVTSVITPREWEIGATSKTNILVDIAYPFMRLSLKETGVSTNAGRATVAYTLSGL